MTTRELQAPQLARLAGLIADETRAACLLALLDGRAWTAGELTRHAGVAASTLSEHLGKLVAGGLLTRSARDGTGTYGWPTPGWPSWWRTWPRELLGVEAGALR